MSARWSASLRLTAWAWLAALLACAALAPLVTDKQFLLAGAFAGALVAATGALCRLAHLPAPLIVTLQLVVVLEWLTVTYARSGAWAGMVPTDESTAHLADLVRSALETSRVSVPPAPVDTAVVACLAAIVALVVLAVDLVAVTWRRPALVGLAFLGVYMAPVSLLAGEVPVLAFVPGAIGYVFLLAAEQRDRLSHWGRHIPSAGSLLVGRERSAPTVTSLVSASRRVGFGAVALAVVLPVLIPTLPRTLLGDGPLTVDGDIRGGSDNGSVEVRNPMLDLRRNLEGQSDEVLVTFTTDDPDPEYLRLAALDTFADDSWTPGPRPDDTSLDLGQTPVIPGLNALVALERFDYDVDFSAQFASSWLPTIYPVQDVAADGDWGIDSVQLDVSARDPDLDVRDLSYSFTSLRLSPSRDQFDDTDQTSTPFEPFLELPSDLPADFASLARDVTADADAPVEQALALQEWFREDGGFRYSIDSAAGDGMETLEDFVTAGRTGYCEQFAAAMALMARSLDIPARVAVGFLRPERQDDGSYAYRGTDMHSWPELYLGGVGWVRFEPTPGVRTGAAPRYNETSVGPNQTTAPDATPTAREPERTPVGPQEVVTGQGSNGSDRGRTQQVLTAAAAALVLLLLVVAPRLIRGAVRQRRWACSAPGAAEAAWRELRDSAVDLGLAFDDRATLRVAGRALRGHLPVDSDAVDALNRLVVRLEQARFARAGAPAAGDMPQARTDVEAVVETLAAGRNRRRLLRATWLPLSLVLPAHGRGAGRAGSGRPAITRDGAVVQVEGTASR